MFDPVLYQVEMHRLLVEAAARVQAEYPTLCVYSVSIWTDPAAAVSSISVDTEENSQAKASALRAYASRQAAIALAQGDREMAALWKRPIPRNLNPAEFLLRDIAQVEHRAFDPGWDEVAGDECWAELSPALAEVLGRAREIMQTLTLHPEAKVGVNGPGEWWDSPVGL